MDKTCKRRTQFYADKVILAPMVRANTLPFRLLCLEYGADLVYTEELIDYRLSKCRRLTNKVLGTVDFVDEHGEIVLRTSPSEKDQLILQLGSNNPERAVKAAKLVAQDIAGVDFNFGCPKSFSLSGGMGAALLEKPDLIVALLTRSVECLDLPITCKIRILPQLERTLELVKKIEQCGVSAIAVHGRTKDQRQGHDNQDHVLREISKVISIPMIANGGSNHIRSYSDILKFKDKTSASSVMIARSAIKNPSIFKSDNNLNPIETVIERFVKLSVKYDTFVSSIKYVLQTMMASGHYGQEVLQKFHAASDYGKLCDVYNLTEWYDKNKISQSKNDFYDAEQMLNKQLEKCISDKRASLSEQGIKEFVCDSIPYSGRIYGPSSPKSQLNDYVNQNKRNNVTHPVIDVFKLSDQKKNQFYCSMIFNGVFYLNKSHSISKKGAEHATSMLVCERLGLVKLDEYKTKVNACNKNIA